jgi:NAD-dependent deacetylase
VEVPLASGSVDEAAIALRRAGRVFALTGAGISAESGIPTFRGDGGLWRAHRAEQLATPEAFARDPRLVWEWYAWRQGVVGACAPNDGHRALQEMETMFGDFLLVTQNVDGLHQRAGSSGVVEMHGNIWKARCALETEPGNPAVRRAHPEASAAYGEWCSVVDFDASGVELPPPCSCGGLLRPHVVWFGEPLNGHVIDVAFHRARQAEVLLSIGTSAQVTPAALLPRIAAETGACVIEVNPETTPNSSLARYALRGGAATILPALVSRARTA